MKRSRSGSIPRWPFADGKMMIIDGQRVITGSFNFTAAAQNHNAENLLVLDDSSLAAQYRTNWERRRAVSTQCVETLPSGPVEGE